MQTCSYCGRPSNKAALFCANCGQSLGVTAPTKEDAHFLAKERYNKRQRVRRINREGSNESLELYVEVIAILAFLHGLTFFLPNTANFANGNLGIFLVAIALLAAIIKSIHDQRLGISRLRSYAETLVLGVVLYGIVIGIFWYLGNLMNTPHALDNWFKLPTPTAKQK
jgi:hypothetical protein